MVTKEPMRSRSFQTWRARGRTAACILRETGNYYTQNRVRFSLISFPIWDFFKDRANLVAKELDDCRRGKRSQKRDDSKVLDLSNFIFNLISLGYFTHETKQFIHYLPQHFLQKKHMLLPSSFVGEDQDSI